MIPETANRSSRPFGVTALGALLLIVCLSTLARMTAAIARHPDQVFTVPSLLVLFIAGLLPAAWIGATAVGLLLGKAWARGSYFTLSILTFVVTAGALSSGLPDQRAKLLAGSCITVSVIMAWGIWYLLGEKVKAWFR